MGKNIRQLRFKKLGDSRLDSRLVVEYFAVSESTAIRTTDTADPRQ